jgi:phosphopantothenoylcysteine synthetase/decarboxylase
MNDKMWSHPATRANVERLKEYGYNFEGPQNGQLACGDTGMGKLSEIDDIVSKITAILK